MCIYVNVSILPLPCCLLPLLFIYSTSYSISTKSSFTLPHQGYVLAFLIFRRLQCRLIHIMIYIMDMCQISSSLPLPSLTLPSYLLYMLLSTFHTPSTSAVPIHPLLPHLRRTPTSTTLHLRRTPISTPPPPYPYIHSPSAVPLHPLLPHLRRTPISTTLHLRRTPTSTPRPP